jgi:type III pantothenate kinase
LKLIIDIGNTRVKAAIFDGDELIYSTSFKFEIHLLDSDIFNQFKIEKCILSSVLMDNGLPIHELNKKFPTLFFTSETKTPVTNLYKSAATLGSDRLAAVIGAAFLFPDKDILVIDAGTCIKYNFINRKKEFIGGAISPGLDMRLEALNEFTSKLPLLSANEGFNKIIGENTNESILSGVMNGALAEANGFIDQYKSMFPDLTIVVTGGNINFFANQLKKPIFANPNLILIGLNKILDYNL